MRYRDTIYGRAVPHHITRHAHPKARPETVERGEQAPDRAAPATGIDYLQLVADAHHEQLAADERIGFHALYSTTQTASSGSDQPGSDQLPGQLSIDALDESERADQRSEGQA